MARGIHLFPFRTEKLSLVTPMVLRNSGRVGSRRFRTKGISRKIGSLFLSLFYIIYFTHFRFTMN